MVAGGDVTPVLRLVGTRVFIGPNLLCRYPAVAGEVAFAPSFTGFGEREIVSIQARFIELFEAADLAPMAPPAPPPAESGPREATAHLIAWLALGLQNFGGVNVVEFGGASGPDGKVYALAAYQSLAFARNAMRIASRMADDLAGNAARLDAHTIALPVARAIANLMQLRGRAHIDHHTADVLAAARARGIPHHFTPAVGTVQLGEGSRQRLIRRTMDDGTSHLGALLCHDKLAAAEILDRIGLPTTAPIRINSVAAAERVAARLGYPVVIKPNLGSEGTGITVDVTRPEELAPAFALARNANLGPVIIEKFAAGDDHRLLVVNGRFVAAAKRLPAHVIGDGDHSIAALIEIANRDPRRGAAKQSRLMERLVYDAEVDRVLARHGYRVSDVPPAGETVRLRGTANISTGGTAVEVSDIVHPEIREIAELAAHLFKVNILGVDYLTTDISRSPNEVPGVICEVNEGPGLRPHWLAGTSRERYLGPILDRMFRPGDTGRIPIVAVAGEAGARRPVARTAAAMLAASGTVTGLAGSDGVTVGGRTLYGGDGAGGEPARRLLFDPAVEAAVMELADASLFDAGLPFDRCDIAAVVADPGGAAGRARSGGEAAGLHALAVAAATRAVVLDADDPNLDALAAAASAPVCLVSRTAAHPRVQAHLRLGGSACVLAEDGAEIVDFRRGAGQRICRLDEISEAGGADASFTLYAVAIARGLDLSPTCIGAGLAGPGLAE